MDLYNSWWIFVLFAAIGVCSGEKLEMPLKLSGVRGRSLNFTAPVPPGTETQTVTWTFTPIKGGSSVPVCTATTQNERVSDTYKDRVNYYMRTYTLEFKSLIPSDSGFYTVNIVDAKLIQLVGQTELEVLEPVADVSILSKLPEAVEINSTVTLTCSAKGSSLSYIWMNNSASVVVDGKHIMQNGSELIIKEVYRSDLQGPITCTAKNQLESLTSGSFNLTVNYGPDPVTLTREPIAEFLKKGSNLTLSCSAKSSPAAEFKWRFNEAELSEKTAVLVLSSLAETNSGNYSCMAHNTKTQRYVTSELTKLTVLEAISGVNISVPNVPLIAGNVTVILTCTSSAGKADSVQWQKHSKPLESSNHIIFNKDNSSLTIVNVQKEDAGEYKCQLKNKISSDAKNYNLTVNYGPDNIAIKGDKEAVVGHTVMMDCTFASFPVPKFEWKFNDTVLNGETNKCLTITNSEYKNSGIYTCIASNEVTGLNRTATHNLTVKESVEQKQDGLSSGAIAGIIIAVLVLLAILIGVCIHRQRKISDIPSPY